MFRAARLLEAASCTVGPGVSRPGREGSEFAR